MTRIAQVAQPPQRGDEPVVVALVQADARFVQHVEHARQPGADLRGQPDALRLAAAKACRSRGRGSGSRGPPPPGNRAGWKPRARSRPRSVCCVASSSSRVMTSCASPMVSAAELADVELARRLRPPHRHRRGFPAAAARRGTRAGLRAHERAQPVAGQLALGRVREMLHLRQQPLERLLRRVVLLALAPLTIFNSTGSSPVPWNSASPERRGQVRERLVHRRAELRRQPAQDGLVKHAHPLAHAALPGRDRALGQRFRGVGHHQFRVQHRQRAQPVARRARPQVAVEGKMLGRQRGQREPGLRVAVIGRITRFPAIASPSAGRLVQRRSAGSCPSAAPSRPNPPAGRAPPRATRAGPPPPRWNAPCPWRAAAARGRPVRRSCRRSAPARILPGALSPARRGTRPPAPSPAARAA